MKKHVAEPLTDVPVIKRQVAALTSTVDGVVTRLGPIEEQFNVNHGNSLRDSNDRTETLARATAERVGVNTEQVAPPQRG